MCAPQVKRRACTGPLAIGRHYRVALYTHCGVIAAYFDGRLWRAAPKLSDGSGNPPRGWDNPYQRGTMRLLRARLTEFRAKRSLVARFVPVSRNWHLNRCD
jgi:hypothetical protein